MTRPPRILADRDINAVEETFAPLGELRLFEGRRLAAADLRDADILLVRSVTRVDEALVAGSRLRLVATATAGTDHIDLAALARLGIAFRDAAGCNARAVAEHVACCLFHHAAARDVAAEALTVGIVGFGNVGQALGRLLDTLGVRWRACDPPRLAGGLAVANGAGLEEVLAADVVTLHVPLVEEGSYPTRHLVDAAAVESLAPGALFINAARGGIVDEAALIARLRDGPPLTADIDCWAGEPAVDRELLRLARFATPHIAGHSLEARLAATALLLRAVLEHLGLPEDAGSVPRAAPAGRIEVATPAAEEGTSRAQAGRINIAAPAPVAGSSSAPLLAALDAVHPLAAQTARLRPLLGLPSARHGVHFDDVRRRHGLRREFAAWAVAGGGLASDTVRRLRALGFAVV